MQEIYCIEISDSNIIQYELEYYTFDDVITDREDIEVAIPLFEKEYGTDFRQVPFRMKEWIYNKFKILCDIADNGYFM